MENQSDLGSCGKYPVLRVIYRVNPYSVTTAIWDRPAHFFVEKSKNCIRDDVGFTYHFCDKISRMLSLTEMRENHNVECFCCVFFLKYMLCALILVAQHFCLDKNIRWKPNTAIKEKFMKSRYIKRWGKKCINAKQISKYKIDCSN